MSPEPGEVAFVLHTHIPWVRGHGVWPVGEEWLFQAWGEAWLPVTRALLRLADDGHRDVLTLSVTPVTAAQIADPRLARDLATWLAIQMWRGEEQRLWVDTTREVRALGPFFWRHHAELLRFHGEVEAAGGLLAVWARLARDGVIELLGGPATHPYLPLTRDPGLVDAQLATGLSSHTAWAGVAPDGIWSPECGYRPAGRVADPTRRPDSTDRQGTPQLPRSGPELPGLEDTYARHGIDHFLVDAATVVRAAGGRNRDWTKRPRVPDPAAGDPYEVVHDGVLVGESDVVAYARDLSVAYHVWSPTAGYPGNGWYRDYYARGTYGVHPSWRVTSRRTAHGSKAVYDPERGNVRVAVDVEHFHDVLRATLDPRPGQLVVAAYDTELFGHWWFEGAAWLESVLRVVHADPRLRTTTLRSRRSRRPPMRRLDLPESSWGFAKGHAAWVTDETRPLWRAIRRAEKRFAEAAPRSVADEVALAQAARELALAQSSDWPFMVTRGNAGEYARARLDVHVGAVEELCAAIAAGDDDATAGVARAWQARDPVPADPSEFLRPWTARSAAVRPRRDASPARVGG